MENIDFDKLVEMVDDSFLPLLGLIQITIQISLTTYKKRECISLSW